VPIYTRVLDFAFTAPQPEAFGPARLVQIGVAGVGS